MRKETAVFKCDVCDKEETVAGDPLITYGEDDQYPHKGDSRWFFSRKLIWNDNYSAPIDMCVDCFNTMFRPYKNEVSEEAQSESMAKLVKKLFGRK